MKTRSAIFEIEAHGITWTVTFTYERGKPVSVQLVSDGGPKVSHSIDNAEGRYKPCVTHCQALVRFVTRKKPVGAVERKRAEKTRPKLGLFHG